MKKINFKQTEIGKIPKDWDILSINDVAEVVGGGTPSTKEPNNFSGEIPWITPKDLSNFHSRYISKGERNITKKGLEESSAKLLPPNSVLLTTRAPVGYVAIAKNEVTTNQGFRSLIPRQNANAEYLYYLLKINTERLKSNASGTTFGELSGSTLKSLKFSFPPIAEQRAIAKILSDLDEKIELNHQMNKTLESIAQAIFKRWFVDFEFPGHEKTKFVNGLPEGWEIQLIGDILKLAYGKALKDDIRHPGDIPVYGSNGQVGWHNEKLVKGPGIVVGRKGNPGVVTWAPTDFFPIDTTFYVVIKKTGMSMYYLLHALQNIDLFSLGADSAVPGLNRNIAYNTEILVPSGKTVKQFDGFVKPLFDMIFRNNQEINKLSSIRDSLLPRLMSGKIRV